MKSFDELKALIDQRGVHEVFGAYGEGWGIEQNAAELAEFLVAMQTLGVTSVLEIGTGYKAGLARFLAEDMGWSVTSVDIRNYGHAFGGIRFVFARSYEHQLDFMPTDVGKFDLVLIDSDHRYEGVTADHFNYAPFATKVIAFHDIAGLRDCEGVQQYWYEIANYETAQEGRLDALKPGYHEIIADTPERGGIGYIVLAEVEAVPEQEFHLNIPGSPEMFGLKRAEAPEPPAKPKPTPRKRTPAKKSAPKKAPAKK